MNPPDCILLVGIGSPHGDDRAGWLVADALAVHAARAAAGTPDSSGVKIRKAATPAELLDWLDGARRLLVCDAVCGAGAPGTLHRWHWPDACIAQVRSAGSHDFDLAAALELAAGLGRLPPEVIVWGIEGGRMRPDDELSPDVEKAVLELVERIRGELGL